MGSYYDNLKNITPFNLQVAEALQLYDLVCMQKNNAVKAIKDLRGKSSKQKQTSTRG